MRGLEGTKAGVSGTRAGKWGAYAGILLILTAILVVGMAYTYRGNLGWAILGGGEETSRFNFTGREISSEIYAFESAPSNGYIFFLKEGFGALKFSDAQTSKKVGERFISGVNLMISTKALNYESLNKIWRGGTSAIAESVALNVSWEEAQAIRERFPNLVSEIVPNYRVYADLNESIPQINVPEVWGSLDSNGLNITGKGVKIAIIDTGIDYGHKDFGCTAETSELGIEGLDENSEDEGLGYIVTFSEPSIAETLKNRVEGRSIASIDSSSVQEQKNKIKDEQDVFLNSFKNLKLNARKISNMGNADNMGEINKTLNELFISEGIISPSGERDIVRQRYQNVINAMALGINKEEADSIKDLPGVKSVSPIKRFGIDTLESLDYIRADNVWGSLDSNGLNITGKGVKIAIIDTGIDYKHPDIDSRDCTPRNLIDSGTTQQFSLNENSAHQSYVFLDVLGLGVSKYWAHYWPITDFNSDNLALNFSFVDYNPSKGIFYLYRDSNYQGEPLIDYYYKVEPNATGWTGKMSAHTTTSSGNHTWYLIYFSADRNNATFPSDFEFSVISKLNGTTKVEWPNCNKVVEGYNLLPPLIGGDNNPMDENKHGTHVASTAAGNGVLKGVAPDAELYAYKVCFSDGSCIEDTILAGMERALDPNQDGDFSDKADIVSISLGGGGYVGDPMSTAANNLVDAGVVVVVAAGNSGNSGKDYGKYFGSDWQTIGSPGLAEKAITVAAACKPDSVNPRYCAEGGVASFSSQGPIRTYDESNPLGTYEYNKPDIAAPGVDICAARWSGYIGAGGSSQRCVGEDYLSISGTSMATPHISGVVALIKQKYPDWTPEQIKQQIMNTASDMGYNDSIQGAGIVDPYKAIVGSEEYPVADIREMREENGVLKIIGSAYGNNFKSYILEYRNQYSGLYSSEGVSLENLGNWEIHEGVLGSIPLDKLSGTVYQRSIIRLKVFTETVHSDDLEAYERISDVAGCRVKGGYNFVSDNLDFMDDNGHGTHVASTAAGNGVLKGVAPDAELYGYKVLNSAGSGDLISVLAGMERALDPNQDGDFSDKADIISMSLGVQTYGFSIPSLDGFIDELTREGVVVIASAGNEGESGKYTIGWPGSALRAIAVGASEKRFNATVVTVASFSSKGFVKYTDGAGFEGIKPNILAPGADICAAQSSLDKIRNLYIDKRGIDLQCYDDEHIKLSGTSMAAPHVSGVVALIKQKHPDWDAGMIRAVLQNSARIINWSFLEYKFNPDVITNLNSSALAGKYVKIPPELYIQGFGEVDALAAVMAEDPVAVQIYNIFRDSDNKYILNGSVYGGSINNISVSLILLSANKTGENFSTNGVTLKPYGSEGIREGIIAEIDSSRLPLGSYIVKLEGKNAHNTFYDLAIFSSMDYVEGFPAKLKSTDVSVIFPAKIADYDSDGRKDLFFPTDSLVDSYGNVWEWPGGSYWAHNSSIPAFYADYAYPEGNYFPGVQVYNPLGNFGGKNELILYRQGIKYFLGLVYPNRNLIDFEGWNNGEWYFVHYNHSNSETVKVELDLGICNKKLSFHPFDFDSNSAGNELLAMAFPETPSASIWCAQGFSPLDNDGKGGNFIALIYPNGSASGAKYNLDRRWVSAKDIVPSDIDNSAQSEILITHEVYNANVMKDGAFNEIVALDSSLNEIWRKSLMYNNYQNYFGYCGRPYAVDMDNDLDKEIFVVCMGAIFGFDHNGNALPGWPLTNLNPIISSSEAGLCTRQFGVLFNKQPAFADIDGDNIAELILISDEGPIPEVWGIGICSLENKLRIYGLDGKLKSGYPKDFQDMALASVKLFVGDINDDSEKEIFYLNNKYDLNAIHPDGSQVEGFPISLADDEFKKLSVSISPFNDIDNDGNLDMVVSIPGSVKAIKFPAKFEQSKFDWPLLRGGSVADDLSLEADSFRRTSNVFVNLNSPGGIIPNDTTQVLFKCGANSIYGMSSIELYHDLDGWQKVGENSSGEISFVEDITGLPEGYYKYNCRASDNRGNVQWGKEFNFSIDRTAPDINLSLGNVVREIQPTMEVFLNEAARVVNYSIDNGEMETICEYNLFEDCSYSNKRVYLGEGIHRIRVLAEDLKGNIAVKEIAFKVDLQKSIKEGFNSYGDLEDLARTEAVIKNGSIRPYGYVYSEDFSNVEPHPDYSTLLHLYGPYDNLFSDLSKYYLGGMTARYEGISLDTSAGLLHGVGRIWFSLNPDNYLYPGKKLYWAPHGKDERKMTNSSEVVSFDMKITEQDSGLVEIILGRYLYTGNGYSEVGTYDASAQVRANFWVNNEYAWNNIYLTPGEWVNIKFVYLGDNEYKIYANDKLIVHNERQPIPNFSKLNASDLFIMSDSLKLDIDNLKFMSDDYSNNADKSASFESIVYNTSETISNISARWDENIYGVGEIRVYVSNGLGQDWCEVRNGATVRASECGILFNQQIKYRVVMDSSQDSNVSMDYLQIGWNGDELSGCLDIDDDGVCEGVDNCELVYNSDQLDSDDDGIGDVCDDYMCQYASSEVCSGDVDEDCDGKIDCDDLNCLTAPICLLNSCSDGDGDGYGLIGTDIAQCLHNTGYDCNDTDYNINPGMSEICNGVDEDCDTQIDEGVLLTYYRDSDGDGYGNAIVSAQGCFVPDGWNIMDGDCDDASNSTYLQAQEICDGKDNSCDGITDEGCQCSPPGASESCGSNVGECKQGTRTCTFGNWGDCIGSTLPGQEICDGKDNDCDGETDENLIPPLCGLNLKGVCRDSVKTCGGSSGWLECTAESYGPNYTAVESSCYDGLDSDCDGRADKLDSDCGCTLTSAQWDRNTAVDGEEINLVLNGVNCVGSVINITIMERDRFSADDASDGENGLAYDSEFSWEVLWQKDEYGLPEYYFIVEVDGKRYDSRDLGGELLTVRPAEAEVENRTITFQKGKNLFSLPLIPENTSVTSVFAPVLGRLESVAAYGGEWRIYHKDGKPSNLAELEIGKGYIVFMNEAGTFNISGTKVRRDRMDSGSPVFNLSAGWNLIGTFSVPSKLANIFSGVQYSQLYTYDINLSRYEAVEDNQTLLDEQYGYWIYSTNSTSFNPIIGRGLNDAP